MAGESVEGMTVLDETAETGEFERDTLEPRHDVMKLFHVTSRVLAERIKLEGFHGHGVLDGERPATGGNWLTDNPETYPTLGLVIMSIEIPADELANQPTQSQRLPDGQHGNDYYVDAKILNRHLDSLQIEP